MKKQVETSNNTKNKSESINKKDLGYRAINELRLIMNEALELLKKQTK